MMELEVLEVRAGRVPRHVAAGRQELLYAVSGAGALHLDGQEHPLERDTAALLVAGEAYELGSMSALSVVAVSAPGGTELERPSVTLRLVDCEEQRADEARTFRVLFQTTVTQFVGVVDPGPTPEHSHPYDEVGYVLEGEGVARIGGSSVPIGPGWQFHLSPGELHSIENAGPGPMRILGLFHPSGSPAQRAAT
jgi:quercetin dioxygenase-like cupin family protein